LAFYNFIGKGRVKFMRILVADKLANDGVEYLRSEGFDVDVNTGLSKEELIKIIGDYEALIVRSATQFKGEIIDHANKMKVVGRAGVGVDNIDIPKCTEKGIMVVNTPFGNINAAAEIGIALAFSLFRNIPQAYLAGKNKDFRRANFAGEELEGKKVGIIGMGKIGAIVAGKLSGCKMEVMGYDPYVTKDRMESLGVKYCETLDEMLPECDLITLHIPKTPETAGILGEKEIKMCKKGARIVNAARGGLIDEKALYEALKAGDLAGAALDVVEKEPDFKKTPDVQDYENPLLELDNVIYVPHLGASTKEASLNVSVQVAKTIAAALRGELVAAINMPPVKIDDKSDIRSYIKLSEILGKVYYQVEDDKISKIDIKYQGELAKIDTKILSLSFLKGFLEKFSSEQVNYINAEAVLSSTGIDFVESKSSSGNENLITASFISGDKKSSISGTVTGKEVRLTDFFGYKFNLEASGNLIVVQNMDIPGIIGKICTVIGESGINISGMQMSRNKKGEKDVSFIYVDSVCEDKVLDKIKGLEGVYKASRISFGD
jgi:D-3-phosphoglycerate dehydrogenase